MVLPLILGLIGSGLGSAGMAGGLGALAAGALGSGIGSAVESGDLEKGVLTGLGALAGGALLGPALGGLGGGAGSTAGQAAAQGATQAATQGLTQGATQAATQGLTQGAAGAAGANLGGGTVTSLAPQLAQAAAKSGVSQAAMTAPLNTGTLIGQGTKDAITGAVNAAAGPQSGIGAMFGPGRIGDVARGGLAFAKTPTGIGAGIGSTIGGMLAPQQQRSGEGRNKDKVNNEEVVPIPRTYNAPPAGYRPGIDPEWNYGLGNAQTAGQILDYNRRFYGGGVVKALGPIKLAAGGIASLGGMDAQELNTDAGVDAPSGGNEKDVVVEAIRAIKGQVEDPRPALGRFLAMYGEDALRDLVDKVQSGKAEGEASKDGGRVQGPGDGMDDRVPAKIKETGEDVLLADSEYVVPADVVSHLGNGSSEAGAKALDAMLDRVRESRTGKKEQAPAIEAKKALPA